MKSFIDNSKVDIMYKELLHLGNSITSLTEEKTNVFENLYTLVCERYSLTHKEISDYAGGALKFIPSIEWVKDLPYTFEFKQLLNTLSQSKYLLNSEKCVLFIFKISESNEDIISIAGRCKPKYSDDISLFYLDFPKWFLETSDAAYLSNLRDLMNKVLDEYQAHLEIKEQSLEEIEYAKYLELKKKFEPRSTEDDLR